MPDLINGMFESFGSAHTAYFSHYIRGLKGKNATNAEMDENRADAIRVCNELRAFLPNWEIYCPAEVDEIVSTLYKSGAIGEKEILAADCQILGKRELVFAYCRNGKTSKGMDVELKHATQTNIPVIRFNDLVEQNLEDVLDVLQMRGLLDG